MEIIVRGRHMTVPSRSRQHATAKLAKLEKLDQKVEQIDVEVSEERNPRQSDHRERVELTIRSPGPAIRAEAASGHRYTALDLAFAKLESRACGEPESGARPGTRRAARSVACPGRDAVPAAAGALSGPGGDEVARPQTGELDGLGGLATVRLADGADLDDLAEPAGPDSRMIPIKMEGDGPVVLREKMHAATPMTIDQALLEMELVGHDFYLFHDSECDRFSVVYRRRGYDYGVIRLVEE